MKSEIKRYQELSLLGKLWRRRWMLAIPFIFFKLWWMQLKEKFEDGLYNPFIDTRYFMSTPQLWGWAVGEAHLKMNWVYTLEEVEKYLANKRGRDI